MKEKVSKIFKDLREGKLSLEKAEQQVLDLFAVSGSCEWCGTAKENPNGLCSECGRFPSPKTFNNRKLNENIENKTSDKQQNGNDFIADVSNSSFNDEKFIEALFAEYNKSYAETKQGQHYPQWLNHEQLKWVLTVAKNCC